MGNKAEKKTILIVEDERDLADIYSTKFSLDGYGVLVAEDGISGLNKAINESPDLILLDVIMPNKNGYEILKDLKSNRRTKDIPVIILSNLGQDYEIKHGIGLGAEKYLVKTNFTPAQVVQEVEKILSKVKNKA